MNATTTIAPITADRTATAAAYTVEITDLDAALRDVATHRAAIEQTGEQLERLEAGHVLSITGGNAEERKARLTLALADDARVQALLRERTEARAALADADRRVTVAKERCRLYRATLTLAE